MSVGVMTEEKIFTVKEAAVYLHVHWRTILRFIKAGDLEAFYVGDEYRITLSAIHAYIAAKSTRNKGDQEE